MSSSLFPIILCLISAVTVAATNFFVKRGGDVLATRMVVSISMGLTVLPFAPFVPMPTPAIWSALAISIVIHWFYQFALIRALHRGDLSLVFPVMRGLAPFITAIAATFVLNESPGLVGWIGLLIATAALIVFAMPEQKGGKHPPVQQAALFWAMVTALGIAFYSVADAYGSRLAASHETVMTFVVWLFLFDWIGISVAAIWIRRRTLWQSVAPQIKGGVMGGFLGTVSYGAALWAFTLSDAANVTAIRETSVVFGAILGAVFLKEAFGARRIAAASILAIGLMMLEFAP